MVQEKLPADSPELSSRWIVALLALPLLFYVALPTRNFYWDGVSFAINIEKHLPTVWLFHPNHLVYTVWGSWIWEWTQRLGFPVRALFLLQALNGVIAGLCILLFYRCLRLRNVSRDLSTAGCLVMAFSATWWKFASDANAYIPALFLLLCTYLLTEKHQNAPAAGLVHAGAMLFHEMAILFLPVGLMRCRKNRVAASVYVLVSLFPVVAAYLSAYKSTGGEMSIRGFLAWTTSHSSDSGFAFNPITNAALSLRGTLRLFFGGKLSDFAGGTLSVAALIALAAALAAFLLYARRHPPRLRFSVIPRHLLLWAGICLTFLFFWMPQNTFYRLFCLPPLMAAGIVMLVPAPKLPRLFWLFVSVLFFWNFTFLIYPQSRTSYNVPLQFALTKQKRWPPGTPIVFSRFHPDLWTISYFNPQASWISMDQAGTGELEQYLASARKSESPLWLEATAYELTASRPEGLQWLRQHERPAELIVFRDAKHEFRFHALR